MQINSRYINLNGITLHVKEAGNPKNPTLLFLHGFPEFWYGWKAQIQYFIQKEYHLLIPDQRGYNLSDKPTKVEQYRLIHLAQDIINLVKHSGKKKVYLIGHDWGAAVAWHLALLHPEYFYKVVILNVPHPLAIKKAFITNLRQLLKSWYMFFFQIPFLPEFLARQNNYLALVKGFERSSLPNTFSEEDFDRYRAAWSQKNSLKSMINWYRAAFRNMRDGDLYLNKKVDIPLKIIWGKNDVFLGENLADDSLNYCSNGSLRFVNDAGHWIAHEKPDLVNRELEAFFKML